MCGGCGSVSEALGFECGACVCVCGVCMCLCCVSQSKCLCLCCVFVSLCAMCGSGCLGGGCGVGVGSLLGM